MARPKGSKSSYTLSPEARVQRMVAPLKDGVTSQVWKKIIANADKDGQFAEDFERYKLEAWKKLTSPVMFLGDKVANMEAFVNIKMASGELDDETFIKYNQLLLNFAKEVNKYASVSADTKAGMARALMKDKEINFDDIEIVGNYESNEEE